MKFSSLPLAGAYEIRLQPYRDERGHFARRFSREVFEGRGLETDFVERSISHNRRRGTLRGLHFQAEPFAETKLVRCTRGAAFDVVVDLRPNSPTFGRWHGVRIDPCQGMMLYVPKGFAHGFQTLEDETDVDYEITPSFRPEGVQGIRHDDPDLAIAWPLKAESVSERDRALPFLRDVLPLQFLLLPDGPAAC